MTCKEKLMKEHPDRVGPDKMGGCNQCPHSYGYLDIPKYCPFLNCGIANDHDCGRCWDREIPETITYVRDTLGPDDVIAPTDKDVFEMFGLRNTNEKQESPRILDSGSRRQFESGAVRDIQEGKGRCDLLPLDVVAEYLEDSVIDTISRFMVNSDTDKLYEALWRFAKHFDDGKIKGYENEIMDQRDYSMLLEVSKHFEEGCKKYGENNWQKGIPVHCYIDSAVRHYLKFRRGDKDEPHDRAFCWNILCAIWTCKHKPELNEYRKDER